ncbi:MAG: hypothetical protein RL671_76 [Pseudomonadota bacterium]|jgi:hypothetical protein|uniref:hypothetical protein n=1 Tax=Novosphingobium sp. APW14 TaxID=3077237 RepID=UPI0028DE26C3|nr:hypothetical protein [Novosphingobium sp. APW14]MDT9013771.1 hypothetical protein [Novosphingobium sp. APW14]
MRALAIVLAASALVAGGSALSAKPKLTPQQRLEKLLEGRVAGKPTTCISTSDTRDMEIIDGVALVYRSGSTLYVNRPKNPEDLDSDDILVIRPSGSQLCRLDMIHTVDRVGHFTTGFINLGDFVPYRRAKQTER